MAGAVPPEEKRRRAPVMHIGFGYFPDDIIFEYWAAQRVVRDLGGLSDAQQMAE